MLQSIRDGIQGWVAALIIGVICVPFAFWGVTSYFTGGGDVIVAKVEGSEISQREFQQAFQSRYQAEQRRLGDAAELIDQQTLKLQVLEGMVSRESLSRYVLDEGYDVSDDELVEALRNNPYLQQDGEFSQSRYGQLLAALNMDPATYEESLRRSLRVGQLQTSLSESAEVSDAEVKRIWQLRNQTRAIETVQLDAEKLMAGINVSEEDIQAWYDDHLNDYVSEERVRVDYLALNVADLEARVEVDSDDIAARYEEDKARYVTPEQRRARHILIGGDVNDASKEKLEAIKARIEAGESFEVLAKENSDDPGSAEQGGDLGLVGRGVMVKPFEDALFELGNSGDISDIVETQFGLHLIQLEEIQAEKGRDIEDMRVEIETTLRTEKAEQLYAELIEQLSELAYENPAELASTAEALELTARTSGWFTREQGTGISSDPAVREAAFSSTVVQDGENSDVVELGEGRAVVLRTNDYQPAEQKELSVVSSEIEKALRAQRARAKASQLADEILTALNTGAALSSAAAATKFAVVDHGAITRESSAFDAAALRGAFALPHPEAGQFVGGRTALSNGNVVVYVVSAVVEADADTEQASAEMAQLRSALKGERGRTELFATLRDIREKSSVKLHLDRL